MDERRLLRQNNLEECCMHQEISSEKEHNNKGVGIADNSMKSVPSRDSVDTKV
jgi:hypothetical protein